MDYFEAFGFQVSPRKKKERLLALSDELITLKKQGATYKQLSRLVEMKFGMKISEDWLEKTLRNLMKNK